MSEAKHTPGPWVIGKKPDAHCRIYAPSETHAIARTYGPDLNGIGVCALTGPLNEADARLIAAAPDLLKAITDLLNSADAAVSCGAVGKHFFHHGRAKARAAIAKAEGRT